MAPDVGMTYVSHMGLLICGLCFRNLLCPWRVVVMDSHPNCITPRRRTSWYTSDLNGCGQEPLRNLWKKENFLTPFYAHGSIHRESVSIIVQKDATI